MCEGNDRSLGTGLEQVQLLVCDLLQRADELCYEELMDTAELMVQINGSFRARQC